MWDPGLWRAGHGGASSTSRYEGNQGHQGHFFQAALRGPDGLRLPSPSAGTGLIPHPWRTWVEPGTHLCYGQHLAGGYTRVDAKLWFFWRLLLLLLFLMEEREREEAGKEGRGEEREKERHRFVVPPVC